VSYPTALLNQFVPGFANTDRFSQLYDCKSQAEGKKYLGKRFTLRKEAQVHQEKIPALEYLTCLMCTQRLHRGFLWSAKCLSTGHEVFLFGVAHHSTMYKRGYMFGGFMDLYHPLVREKFEQSECLYTEVDPSQFTPSEESVLSEAVDKLISSQVQQLSPEYLSQGIEEIWQFVRPRSIGLDEGLREEAKQQGIPVIPLESVDELVTYYEKLGRDVPEPFAGEAELDMIDAAQSGNLDQVLDEEKSGIEKNFFSLAERNSKFSSKIIEALKTGQMAMFAIGIAHFLGKRGVLGLLSSDPDIKVSRIDLP
jgi:hypothetical protein